MHTLSIIEALQLHPFCEGLAQEHIELLATIAAKEEFEPGRLLFREGQRDPRFFLLLTGVVVLEIGSMGRIHRVQTLSAGDELGWSALIPSKGKYFDARVIQEARAVVIDGSKLMRACEENPAFGYIIVTRMFHIVAERLQATRLQLLDVYGESKPVP